MKKKVFFYLLVIPLFSCGQQKEEKINTEEDSINYSKKAIAFIKEVKSTDISDTSFILVDSPFGYHYSQGLQELLKDSSTFSNEELQFIRDKKFHKISIWNNNVFPNLKIIKRTLIDSILKKMLV